MTRNDAEAVRETERLLDDPEGAPGGTLRRGSLSQRTLRTVRRYRVLEACLVGGLLLLLALGLLRSAHNDDRRILNRVCTTRECVNTAYELINSLNETADPCDDFYEFATGGWREAHPIPADTGLFGVGQFVTENNNNVLRDILKGGSDSSMSAADKANMKKLRKYYNSCLDTKTLNKAGAKPLLSLLGDLHGLMAAHHNDKDALTAGFAWLHLHGFPVLFRTDVTGDPGRAPTRATPNVGPAPLGLPDGSYYEDKDSINVYRDQMRAAVEALNDEVHASKHGLASHLVDEVLAFEKALAALQPDPTFIADPRKVYNPMSVKKLEKLAPFMEWSAYLHAMSPKERVHDVIVVSPQFMEDVTKLVRKTPAFTLRAYMYWSVIRDAGLFLGPDVPLAQPARRLANFVAGVELDAEENRESTCFASTTRSLGFMAGRFFAQRTFGPESKKQVEAMVEALRRAFYRRLHELAWLDVKTRNFARGKAEAIKVKVGYPTNPDSTDAKAIQAYYEDLEVGTLHFDQEISARKLQTRHAWEVMGGDINTGLIGDMMTAEVNAEYNADQNEIVFPAGLLQKPYFDPSWPMYLQYGALGTTAGHELSHAFDPAGRMFDAEGFLRDWWTSETSAQFEERQRCLEKQYSNYTWDDGHGGVAYVQSDLTIGEDVADAGGLLQSYNAWMRLVREGDASVLKRNMLLPGLQAYTQEQMFFLVRTRRLTPGVRRGVGPQHPHRRGDEAPQDGRTLADQVPRQRRAGQLPAVCQGVWLQGRPGQHGAAGAGPLRDLVGRSSSRFLTSTLDDGVQRDGADAAALFAALVERLDAFARSTPSQRAVRADALAPARRVCAHGMGAAPWLRALPALRPRQCEADAPRVHDARVHHGCPCHARVDEHIRGPVRRLLLVRDGAVGRDARDPARALAHQRLREPRPPQHRCAA